MLRFLIYGIIPVCFMLFQALSPASAQEATPNDVLEDPYRQILQQVEELKQRMEEMTRQHEAEIQDLKSQLDLLRNIAEKNPPAPGGESSSDTQTAAGDDETSLYETIRAKVKKPLEKDSLAKGLDLDASVVIDTFYYHDDTDEGMAHVKDEILGFGHSHGADEDHHHSEVENGFNLRHIELGLSAAVDPFFRAWTTLAIEDGNSEIEEAVIQTTNLPYDCTLSGGKFLSGIGRINWQHSHNWDFFDQPLVYELMLGPHGLQEKGVQLTWLAPAPFYLLFGAEALNGENEKMFQKVEAEELTNKDGPRLWTGFVKFGPDLGPRHAMQMGISYTNGYHQEAHDGDGDGSDDHWLKGRNDLWGADLVYKFNAQKAHGFGDFVLQGEYFYRKKDLEVAQHDLIQALTGRDRIDRQDGYYVQALYGFLPQWRGGLRWEEVGGRNDMELPDLTDYSYKSSNRISAMIDWRLSEFSLLRAQAAHSDLELEDGLEKAWELILQWQVTFGEHAAHDF